MVVGKMLMWDYPGHNVEEGGLFLLAGMEAVVYQL